MPNLLGPGQAGVLVGNQQNNRVTVQAPSANGNQYTPVQTLGSSSSTSEGLAPGDVQWAFLDQGATFPDAIVVGTGSNSVEVYRTISINRRRAHLRPVAGDLLRRHCPGQRHRGRHQRRRHSGHAGRRPGQQRRLRDFRFLRRQRRLGGHSRAAFEVRRRRSDRGDRRAI